jgi:hypothetical protein
MNMVRLSKLVGSLMYYQEMHPDFDPNVYIKCDTELLGLQAAVRKAGDDGIYIVRDRRPKPKTRKRSRS